MAAKKCRAIDFVPSPWDGKNPTVVIIVEFYFWQRFGRNKTPEANQTAVFQTNKVERNATYAH